MSELLVKGKTYRLFKRDPATGKQVDKTFTGWDTLPWNFRFTFRGTSYARCLETADESVAQKTARNKAKSIIAGVIGGEQSALDATKARQASSATVAEIVSAYRTASVDASADTRQQNIHALNLILARVYNTEAPGSLPATDITAGAARKWFALANTAAAAEKDQRQAASIKRSANSRFAHARSLFIARALPAYAEADLTVPECVQEFANGGKAHRFNRLPRSEYNPPSDKIIQDTLAAWEALEDKDLFLAIGHELSFGLRKGELTQARWGWWSVRQGYPVLDSTNVAGPVDVKNQTGMIQVRALDPWFTVMQRKAEARGWIPPEHSPDRAGHIISGNASNREDAIFRAVGMWLRGFGWATQKTNHALRAYAGSQIAMKYGIYDAQTWLRHSTVKVTENHYTTYVKRFRPTDPNALPASWASSAAVAPALRLLEARA